MSDPTNSAPDNLRALVTALIDALNALELAQHGDSRLPDTHPWDATPKHKGTSQSGKEAAAKGHLTMDEICAELHISRSTFYDWRAKGKAPRCIKLPNGDIRIRRCEFERWLTEREDAA